MEVITIEAKAFREVIAELAEIKIAIASNRKQQPLSEHWLDISDVCNLLHISKRTLQSYRDNKILAFSQISGKIYFKASDIDELLNRNYNKSRNSRK
jgi:hypothetical protein